MVKDLMVGMFSLSKEEQYKLEPEIINSNDSLIMYSYAKNIKKGKDIKNLEDKFLSLENNDHVYYWCYDMPESDIYRCINILHNKKDTEDYIDTLVEKYLLIGEQTLMNKDSKYLKK